MSCKFVQMFPPRTCVVLPAAGIGERTGLSTPKQFNNLLGRPLISYTIEAFEKIPWIKFIILVVSPEWKSLTVEVLQKFAHKRVVLVDGAKTRHRSIKIGVLSAFEAVPDVDILIIHDAVRPFVDEKTIRDVTEVAVEYGCAGMIRPLVSTVVSVDSNGLLEHALDRSRYRASEMPQAFRAELIRNAYDLCTDDDLDFGTECLDLVHKYGQIRAKLLDGSTDLWKVTHCRDLVAAESVVRVKSNGVLILFNENNIAIESFLRESLLQALNLKHHHSVPVIYRSLADYLTMQGESVAELTNCTLFIFRDSDCSKTVQDCTATVLERTPKDSRVLQVIIYLLIQNDDDLKVDRASLFIDTIRSASLSVNQRAIISGVVVFNTDDRVKLIDVITSLIYDRNASYNGVTMFI